MKIVAIGGGNNSNIKKNGLPQIYEQEAIDKEIIKLSSKNNPNVLFVSHASDVGFEHASYNKIVNTYSKVYSCNVKLLSVEMLKNSKITKSLVEWADIIYVGGGNTKRMMELWSEYKFDKLLKKACNEDKILCGISAGANCYFGYSCSDSLKIELNNPDAPYVLIKGLGLVDLVLNPHANYAGRLEGIKDILKENKLIGLSLSNNIAIEIIDDDYKLIEGFSSEGEEIFAMIGYWHENKYHVKRIPSQGKIKELICK